MVCRATTSLTVWGHGRALGRPAVARPARLLRAVRPRRPPPRAPARTPPIVVGSFAAAAALARAGGTVCVGLLRVSRRRSRAGRATALAAAPRSLVALVWLLVDDARAPSRASSGRSRCSSSGRTCTGRVTLGVLLVLLAGCHRRVAAATPTRQLVRARRARGARRSSRRRTRHTCSATTATVLFNGEFAKYLPDWMPTALAPERRRSTCSHSLRCSRSRAPEGARRSSRRRRSSSCSCSRSKRRAA